MLDEAAAGSLVLAADGFASGICVTGIAVVEVPVAGVVVVVDVGVAVVVVELRVVLESNDDGLLGGTGGTTDVTISAAASSFLVGGGVEVIGVTGPLVDLSKAATLGVLATSVMIGSDLLSLSCSLASGTGVVAEAGVTLLPVAAGALVAASCLGVVDGTSDIIDAGVALNVDVGAGAGVLLGAASAGLARTVLDEGGGVLVVIIRGSEYGVVMEDIS